MKKVMLVQVKFPKRLRCALRVAQLFLDAAEVGYRSVPLSSIHETAPGTFDMIWEHFSYHYQRVGGSIPVKSFVCVTVVLGRIFDGEVDENTCWTLKRIELENLPDMNTPGNFVDFETVSYQRHAWSCFEMFTFMDGPFCTHDLWSRRKLKEVLPSRCNFPKPTVIER